MVHAWVRCLDVGPRVPKGPGPRGGQGVRIVTGEDGEPWWVAADVCAVLGVANVAQAMSRLDEDERDDVISNDVIGRKQSVTVVNESGLYSLILGSRKPEAKAFKKWVTSEVLPAIHKTGSYTAARATRGALVCAS